MSSIMKNLRAIHLAMHAEQNIEIEVELGIVMFLPAIIKTLK